MTQETQCILHFLLQRLRSILLDLFELADTRHQLVSLLHFSLFLFLVLFLVRAHSIAGRIINPRQNVGVEVQESMQVGIHCIEAFARLARLYQPFGGKNQKRQTFFQIVHSIAKRR